MRVVVVGDKTISVFEAVTVELSEKDNPTLVLETAVSQVLIELKDEAKNVRTQLMSGNDVIFTTGHIKNVDYQRYIIIEEGGGEW